MMEFWGCKKIALGRELIAKTTKKDIKVLYNYYNSIIQEDF